MGIIIGVMSAFITAGLDVALKKLSGINPNALTFLRSVSALPVLAALVFILASWQVPPWPFWRLVLFIVVPLEILLMYTGTKALHLAPMSLVAPMGALTSVFLLPLGVFVAGESFTVAGVAGVLLIIAGSLLLGWHKGEKFTRTFGALTHNAGVRWALLGAFSAALSITAIKLTFNYAPPAISALYTVGIMAIVLLPYVALHGRIQLKGQAGSVAGLSLLSGAGIALHYGGVSIMPAAYFISLKRLSIIINVFFGGAFFKEGHLMERALAGLLMFGGIILIYFG
jgi:drug/metabolite transporter (DMT)-like permease